MQSISATYNLARNVNCGNTMHQSMLEDGELELEPMPEITLELSPPLIRLTAICRNVVECKDLIELQRSSFLPQSGFGDGVTFGIRPAAVVV